MSRKLLPLLTALVVLAIVSFSSWAGINDRFAPLELVDVTATATEINKLASIGSGDLVTTTNTKTLTNKTLSGPIFTIGAAHIFALAEDWALSAAEMLKTLLIATSGSGNANIVVTGGSTGDVKIVRNESNGTVTIKEAGQSGVSIASGSTAVVMHNGVTYIRVTGDAAH